MKPNYKMIATFIRESIDQEYLNGCTGIAIVDDRTMYIALSECYLAEYGHAIKHGTNYQRTFADWLQGLPSALNFPFSNYDILKLAVSWGSLPEDYKESQADKTLENYFMFLAMQYGKDARKCGVSLFR